MQDIITFVWVAALLLAAITLVADVVALRRRANVALRAAIAPAEPRPLTRATDLLPIVAFQAVVTMLAQFTPLARNRPVSSVLVLLFSVSLLALVALSLGFALVNMRPPVIRETPRPTIPKLAAEPGTIYQHRVRSGVDTLPTWLAFLAFSLALAVDLIPWLFAHVPDVFGIRTRLGITGLPDSVENALDTTLLIFGALGLGMLLASIALVGRRPVLTADQYGLHLYQGIVRRVIPWQTARQFLVRDHGDGRYSYQLAGSGPRDVITWWEHPERHQGEITAAEMAAAVIAFSKLEPQWLDPQATAALIHQRVAGWAGQVADAVSHTGE